MQHETKTIMHKPLALKETAVSIHYKYMEPSRSYCRLLLRIISIVQA